MRDYKTRTTDRIRQVAARSLRNTGVLASIALVFSCTSATETSDEPVVADTPAAEATTTPSASALPSVTSVTDPAPQAENDADAGQSSVRKDAGMIVDAAPDIIAPSLGFEGEPVILSAPPDDCPEPLAREELRVLAYNIKRGLGNDNVTDLQRTESVVRSLQPDLVALQEVDQEVPRSNRVKQAQVLGDGLCMYSAFGRFFDLSGGEYGMAVLSRFPFVDAQNLRLPAGQEPRSSVVVQVQHGPGGPVINFASIHFYRSEQERVAQANALVTSLADLEHPLIIAGDFNSTPQSPVLAAFDGSWQKPDKGADHFTFPSDQPRTEIDFTLFKPAEAFSVLEVDVIDEPLVSDHRPLLTVVQLVK